MTSTSPSEYLVERSRSRSIVAGAWGEAPSTIPGLPRPARRSRTNRSNTSGHFDIIARPSVSPGITSIDREDALRLVPVTPTRETRQSASGVEGEATGVLAVRVWRVCIHGDRVPLRQRSSRRKQSGMTGCDFFHVDSVLLWRLHLLEFIHHDARLVLDRCSRLGEGRSRFRAIADASSGDRLHSSPVCARGPKPKWSAPSQGQTLLVSIVLCAG